MERAAEVTFVERERRLDVVLRLERLERVPWGTVSGHFPTEYCGLFQEAAYYADGGWLEGCKATVPEFDLTLEHGEYF